MPASITHLIIQQRMKNNLNPPFKALLNGFETNPYANFGSIGPDFLFFTIKEYGIQGTDNYLNMLFKFYDALEPFIEFKNKIDDKVEENIIDPIENFAISIDQNFFNGIFTELKNTGALLSSALISSLSDVVVAEIDFFYPFYPRIQQGCPENEWYWFDFLHYRKTGKFCSNMWQIANAQNNDNLKRYCLGYTSHIGSDVVGHSYVNAIVGGPYRNHWRRHKLTENWIDAYAKNHYNDIPEIVSTLSAATDGEDYISNAISGSNYYRLTEFKDSHNITRFPKDLGNMILRALEMTYSGIAHPPMLDFPNLEQTYLTWQKWFKRTTTIGKAHRPVPVPPPSSVAFLNSYITNFPTMPSNSGSGSGGGFSIKNIIRNLSKYLNYLVAVLDYTFNWIISNASNILSLLTTNLLELLKWLLYQLQKAIYEIAETARFIMVLCGYVYPEPEDLNHPQFGKAFISTDFVGITQGGIFDYSNYPYKQVVPVINCKDDVYANAKITGNEYQLKYPISALEKPYSEPTPKPFTVNCMPESFIDGVFPYNSFIERLYLSNQPYPPVPFLQPKPTHKIDQSTWSSHQLGSALSFSQRLINNNMGNMPNFNLDSDRGYGWKEWSLINNQGNPTLNDDDPLLAKYNI